MKWINVISWRYPSKQAKLWVCVLDKEPVLLHAALLGLHG